MTLTWVAGACVIAAASFVMGLAGFGIGLVALAFLPFGMSPVTAVALLMLNRLIGLMLLFAVGLEWLGLYPRGLAGRGRGSGPGFWPASPAAPSAHRDRR